MSTAVNWTWHIVAAIVGVCIQPINCVQKVGAKVVGAPTFEIGRCEGGCGRTRTRVVGGQKDKFLRHFNEWTFLGRNTKYVPDFSEAVKVELVMGAKVYCARGTKFIEVKRVNPKGRAVYYWLLDRRSKGSRSPVMGDVQ